MASPVITPVVAPANGNLNAPLTLPVHTPLSSLLGPRPAVPEAEKEKEKEMAMPKEEVAPAKGPASPGPGQRKPVPLGAKSGPLRPGARAGKGAAATPEPQEPAEDKPAFQPSVAQVVMPTTPSEWSPAPKGRGVFSKIGGAWDRVCSIFNSPKDK